MSDKIQNLPLHIAIIPDGNRRWAKKKGLNSWLGHLRGVKALEKILMTVLDSDIKFFTFWGGSFDNLTKRTKKEVDFLFYLYVKHFTRLAKKKEIKENEMKISVLGRWKEISPPKTIEAINNIEKMTAQNGKKFLNFLIAYNGTDEIISAVRKIAASPEIKPAEINEETIKQNLWTKDLPPVDLVIRTGVENDPHNSTGFMMWDTVYSHYYFTKTLWPDFKPEEFKKAISDYLKTEKRMGE